MNNKIYLVWNWIWHLSI